MSAVIELDEIQETSLNGMKPFLINVKLYHQMIEKGVLTTEHKIELLNGKLYEKYTGKPYRISAELYDEMIENGILDENDNVELLDGRIIEKMPKGKKHSSYNDSVTRYFYKNVDEKCVIRNQNPILLAEFAEPEPDIVLAKLPREKYLERLPQTDDILLFVEVSDSTLNFDRNIKGLRYSRAGIRQYLIVNVENKTVEDYQNPTEDGYASKQTYEIGDTFILNAFPEIEIAVEDFLQS